MKTLIIGLRDGNLADKVAYNLPEDTELWAPDQGQFDVLDYPMISKYILTNGPWDEILYCAAVNKLKWIHDIRWYEMQHVYGVNVFGFV